MNETSFIADLWNYSRKYSMFETISAYRPKLKELVIHKIKNQFTISNDTTILTGNPEEIMQKILDDMCKVLKVDQREMMNKRRYIQVAYLRHLFVKLCVDHKVATLKGVGNFMNRDHTTIIHSFRTAESLIQAKDPAFMTIWLKYLVNGDALFTGIYDKSILQMERRVM